MFFYAGWPAVADPKQRGVPDPSKQFGPPGTVVWETWKNSAENIFD
ncbi:MAG: hypothetical protein ACRD8O_16375 [Bryobacteraceae bacterium]